MEKIVHQLRWLMSQVSKGFIHPRWLAGFPVASRFNPRPPTEPKNRKPLPSWIRKCETRIAWGRGFSESGRFAPGGVLRRKNPEAFDKSVMNFGKKTWLFNLQRGHPKWFRYRESIHHPLGFKDSTPLKLLGDVFIWSQLHSLNLT